MHAGSLKSAALCHDDSQCLISGSVSFQPCGRHDSLVVDDIT